MDSRTALREAIDTVREILEDPEVVNVHGCHVTNDDVNTWQSALDAPKTVDVSDEQINRIVYLVNGFEEANAESNFGDAKEWRRHLHNALRDMIRQ